MKKDTKFKQAGPNAKVDLEDSIDRIVKQAKGGGKSGKKGEGMLDDLKANPKDQLKQSTKEPHPLKDAPGYKQQSHKDLTRLRNEQQVR